MLKVILNDVFLKLNLEYKNTVWSVVMCTLGIILRNVLHLQLYNVFVQCSESSIL